MNLFVWLLRLVLAGLFAWAGIAKILDPAQLLTDVESYRLLPYPAAVAVVYLLPPFELVCAAGLFIPALRKGASLWLVLLLLLFTAAIVLSWARGLDLSCGCFGGSATETSYPWLLTRDLLMLLAALIVFLKTPPHR